jgi:hypothetical protein
MSIAFVLTDRSLLNYIHIFDDKRFERVCARISSPTPLSDRSGAHAIEAMQYTESTAIRERLDIATIAPIRDAQIGHRS